MVLVHIQQSAEAGQVAVARQGQRAIVRRKTANNLYQPAPATLAGMTALARSAGQTRQNSRPHGPRHGQRAEQTDAYRRDTRSDGTIHGHGYYHKSR